MVYRSQLAVSGLAKGLNDLLKPAIGKLRFEVRNVRQCMSCVRR